MSEYSFITLNIVALGKAILFAFFILFLIILYTKNKPIYYLVLFTGSIFIFYLILSYPLQRMWWGNNGDEAFVFAYLAKVIHSGIWHDFYYAWLPNFYPPLYFWLTGLFSRLFTFSGIVAAKIGVLGTIILWFIGSYWWQKIYWSRVKGEGVDERIFRKNWFWLLTPITFFLLLDFDAIILKPYEAVSALFGVILIGMVGESLDLKKWQAKHYLFLGLSAGLIFLTFYFWWFILIPVLIYLALRSKNKTTNLSRVLWLGVIIFIIASPYLIPLLWSYIRYGSENWQAVFFTPKYLVTFLPWSALSWKAIILILGLFGLIFYRRHKFILANLAVLAVSYLYYFLNLIYFTLGQKPFQPIKPFLFLGTASLALGAVYVLIQIYDRYLSKLKISFQRSFIIVIVIIAIPFLPFGNFIQEDIVLYQIEADLKTPPIKGLADWIAKNLPDYQKKTWLTSGTPDLNAYLPLSYYLAYNPHFSHQASNYSERMQEIELMVQASSAQEFCDIIQGGSPEKIDGLILYHNPNTDYYPLFFWADNYPNGGKELELRLPAALIVEKYWDKVYDENNWVIFLKK